MQRRLPRRDDGGRIGAHDHAFGDGERARWLKRALFFNLDKANAAGALRFESRMIAERRNVDAGRGGGFIDGLPGPGLHGSAVDGDVDESGLVHGVSPLAAATGSGRGRPIRSSHSRSQRRQRFASARATSSLRPSSTSLKLPSRSATAEPRHRWAMRAGEVVEIMQRRDVVPRRNESRLRHLARAEPFIHGDRDEIALRNRLDNRRRPGHGVARGEHTGATGAERFVDDERAAARGGELLGLHPRQIRRLADGRDEEVERQGETFRFHRDRLAAGGIVEFGEPLAHEPHAGDVRRRRESPPG